MYTLRTISPISGEENFSLGNYYSKLTLEADGEIFSHECAAKNMPENSVVCIISSELGVNYFIEEDWYSAFIMTESGKTFCRLK